MRKEKKPHDTRFPVEWPYAVDYDKETRLSCDVLVLGGGLSGCFAAIKAAERGQKVILVDKGCVKRSGAAGSGIDHWMDCPSNPASRVSPEEYAKTPIEQNKGGFGNYITSYITAKESWNALLELEEMGMKIRDLDNEFKGADFRDEKTRLLFSYDYKAKHCLRIWGTGMKPALYKKCKALGVKIVERTMATSVLTENGDVGAKAVGATGLNNRTGEFYIFNAKAVILCMATPERIWIFSSEHTGLVGRDGPPTNSGNGFAMAYRAGAKFLRMEASSHEEWGGSTGIHSTMFGSGSNFATWYPCSIVDSNGKQIPWVGKNGIPIKSVSERVIPKDDQGFFSLVLGGAEGKSPAMPQLIADLDERVKKGEYALPLYADLPGMPAHERRAIFGLMVGQEGHTWPVYRNLTRAGFDPDKDLLQAYESTEAPYGWRRLRYGGLFHDWKLMSSIEGLFAAGQQLFDGIGTAHASSTGRWAGEFAALYSDTVALIEPDQNQIDKEKERVYAPVNRNGGINWKELAAGVAKVMQDYCGDTKTEELMTIGLKYLDEISESEAKTLSAENPHELMRAIEVIDIITCGELIIQASMARKCNNPWLSFERLDCKENNPDDWKKWTYVRKTRDNRIETGGVPLDYAGDMIENYLACKKELEV